MEYYIDLNNREEDRMEVEMKQICEAKERDYRKEIKELKEIYIIRKH